MIIGDFYCFVFSRFSRIILYYNHETIKILFKRLEASCYTGKKMLNIRIKTPESGSRSITYQFLLGVGG